MACMDAENKKRSKHARFQLILALCNNTPVAVRAMSVSTSLTNEDSMWSTYLGEIISDERISGVAFLPPGCELQSPAKLRPALFAQGALEGISPADWAQLGGVFDHIEETEENRYVVADPGSDHIE